MQFNFPRSNGRCRRCLLRHKARGHKVGRPCHPCQSSAPQEHATLLMIAAMIGAATRVADTLIAFGRATGWWH